jgi:protein tyrosine phosphatase
MIWQENIKTVVMLTNLNENRTIVCEKYWPKFGLKCRFGNIVILNVSSKMFPSYVKREFQVKYQNKTHRVQQFQYIKWPDHGVPTNLQEFTPFMKVISGIYMLSSKCKCTT